MENNINDQDLQDFHEVYIKSINLFLDLFHKSIFYINESVALSAAAKLAANKPIGERTDEDSKLIVDFLQILRRLKKYWIVSKIVREKLLAMLA